LFKVYEGKLKLKGNNKSKRDNFLIALQYFIIFEEFMIFEIIIF